MQTIETPRPIMDPSGAAILVVDDNPAKRVAIKAVLAPIGHEIVEVESGEAALRAVMSQTFAVVLMDVQMPLMDGYETAKLIRMRVECEHTPIIFITAHSEEETRTRDAYASGAVDFMFPPLVPDVLRAKVAIFVDLFLKSRELEHSLNDVTMLSQQLQELDKLKDDFVATVSHELRTPLTAIIGYLELLLDGEAGELPDEHRKLLTIIERNSNRLLRLVGDLLFVAQVQANALALNSEEVDLPTLVEESAESARPLADSKEIELVVMAGQMPPFRGDPVRLAQMLDNLVVNAVKFTPRGGRVGVALSFRGGQARVEVSDTGMGVSPEELERLFERFFRTSAATESAIEGTGLGLSIVRSIAEAHGGTVEVESQVGTGTTFRVVLPLDAAVEPTRELAAMIA